MTNYLGLFAYVGVRLPYVIMNGYKLWALAFDLPIIAFNVIIGMAQTRRDRDRL